MSFVANSFIKWSKSKKDKYDIHLYVESKKMIQMNLFIKQKQTHRHKKQIYGYQGDSGRGGGTN